MAFLEGRLAQDIDRLLPDHQVAYCESEYGAEGVTIVLMIDLKEFVTVFVPKNGENIRIFDGWLHADCQSSGTTMETLHTNPAQEEGVYRVITECCQEQPPLIRETLESNAGEDPLVRGRL